MKFAAISFNRRAFLGHDNEFTLSLVLKTGARAVAADYIGWNLTVIFWDDDMVPRDSRLNVTGTVVGDNVRFRLTPTQTDTFDHNKRCFVSVEASDGVNNECAAFGVMTFEPT